MELTKDKLRALRVAMDAALAKIAKEHGLAQLRAGSCTFEKTGAFSFRVEGLADGGLTKEQRRYDENMWLGLPMRGAQFESGRKQHTTWGLNSTGTKVITECSDGQRYNWPLDSIKRFFPQDPIARDLKKIVGACKDGGAP